MPFVPNLAFGQVLLSTIASCYRGFANEKNHCVDGSCLQQKLLLPHLAASFLFVFASCLDLPSAEILHVYCILFPESIAKGSSGKSFEH